MLCIYIHIRHISIDGDAIEFGTLLLLIDLIGYPHANLTSSNLFSYGNGMGPYLPKRILNQFREVKKLDVLAQRIKTEALKTLNEIRNHQQIEKHRLKPSR